MATINGENRVAQYVAMPALLGQLRLIHRYLHEAVEGA